MPMAMGSLPPMIGSIRGIQIRTMSGALLTTFPIKVLIFRFSFKVSGEEKSILPLAGRYIERAKVPPTTYWEEEETDIYGKKTCLLYTSDAADDLLCVDLGGR